MPSFYGYEYLLRVRMLLYGYEYGGGYGDSSPKVLRYSSANTAGGALFFFFPARIWTATGITKVRYDIKLSTVERLLAQLIAGLPAVLKPMALRAQWVQVPVPEEMCFVRV